MSMDVKIPAVGESVSSGVISEWHKQSGDSVKTGDTLLTLETDKVSTEITAEDNGTLEILVDEGSEVEVGQVVARIGEAAADGGGATDQDTSDRAEESGGLRDGRRESGEPAAGRKDAGGAEGESDEAGRSAVGGRASGETGGESGEPAEAAAPGEGGSATGERASSGESSGDGVDRHGPGAARMMREQGIRPEEIVERSGHGGRITKEDIEAFLRKRAEDGRGGREPAIGETAEREAGGTGRELAAGPSRSLSGAAADTEPITTRKRMSPMRRKIAQQLVNVQRETAHLTTFNECDMSSVIAIRKRMQESFQKRHEIKLGFMSFFLKAVVNALQEVPAINARIDGEDLVQNHYYDIGVAVSTERGLLVPVLRGADRKSFAALERDLAEFAAKARDGRIQIDDLKGGVFTVSNGGIYGSLLSTPILNPPQSGILGMHAIKERPVVVDGEVVVRPMMNLALSYDHRVVDGREAVTFLATVKEAIEDPMQLIL